MSKYIPRHLNHYLKKIKDTTQRLWVDIFWKNPHHFLAFKVTVCIAIILIPSVLIFNNYKIGSALSLGAIAMASAETDFHPLGRLKSASITLLLFFITSSIVGLLTSYTILFGFALAIMVFGLTIVAGINSRLQGISFGTLFFIIYIMLGISPDTVWYQQSILYVLGAAFYTLLSVLLLYIKPFKLVRREISKGFTYLAKYIELKAELFTNKSEDQKRIVNNLAQQNILLAKQIEICKDGLEWFSAESNEEIKSELKFYYHKWFLLQEMQERATSSQLPHNVTIDKIKNKDLIEGFGQLMNEIAKAIDIYANSLHNNIPYQHPFSLEWTTKAVDRFLNDDKKTVEYYSVLSFLMDTLITLEEDLQNKYQTEQTNDNSDLYFQKPTNQSLYSLINPSHPRFRFAIRLTIGLVLGYYIMHLFNIQKGAWILLTTLIVCQQTYSAMRQRLFRRITGTLAGVLVGAFLGQLFPTILGQLLMLLGTVYAIYYYIKKNYTVAVIFMTIYVYVIFNLLYGEGEAYMLPRIIDTIIGGVIAYIVVRFLWPNWQYKRIPDLLSTAIIKNKIYFKSICNNSITDSFYIYNRREAYNADNDLTSAWNDMRIELKEKNKYDEKVYYLTYLNHTLLSYIAAFGIYKTKENDSQTEEDIKYCNYEEDIKYCNYVENILEQTHHSLSQTANDEECAQLSTEFDNNFNDINSASHKQPIILIYNIARVSKELFLKTCELNQ